MNKSTLKKRIIPVILVIFIIIQFIPKNSNTAEQLESHPLFDNSTPQSVVDNFEAACADCHSNHTEYPWYAKIAPVSFLIDNHVREGKKHFNSDEWNNYSLKRKNHKLEECIEMMEEGEMPMKGYVIIHKDADLTAAEKKEMINWFKSAIQTK